MITSGIVTPSVAFSTITYGSIAPGSYFFGFDLDNGGLLSKMDNLGNITVIEAQNQTVPYQEYRALLTQSSTSAPVADVLNDTLTVSGSWSYQSTGSYHFTSFGSFVDPTKVEVFIPGADVLGYVMSNAPFNLKSAARVSIDTIEVRTGSVYYVNDAGGGVTLPVNGTISSLLKDDLLQYTPIVIRVWS